MRAVIFGKLFIFFIVVSLLTFAVTSTTLTELAKMFAFGTVISIVLTIVYPEFRGLKKGDKVSLVPSSSVPFFVGRMGVALSNAKKGKQLKVRFGNGSEATGVVESYEGVFSPPRIRLLYEERIIE